MIVLEFMLCGEILVCIERCISLQAAYGCHLLSDNSTLQWLGNLHSNERARWQHLIFFRFCACLYSLGGMSMLHPDIQHSQAFFAKREFWTGCLMCSNIWDIGLATCLPGFWMKGITLLIFLRVCSIWWFRHAGQRPCCWKSHVSERHSRAQGTSAPHYLFFHTMQGSNIKRPLQSAVLLSTSICIYAFWSSESLLSSLYSAWAAFESRAHPWFHWSHNVFIENWW